MIPISSAGKLILVDQIEPLIQTIRGHKVLLDSDLAKLYGVPTKRLNEQVRRNRQRFPEDFMFRLEAAEAKLRSQIATSRSGGTAEDATPLMHLADHGAIMVTQARPILRRRSR